MPRLTGERPVEGVTPPSLLELHRAGYRAIAERLGEGAVLDIGCGDGSHLSLLAGEGRWIAGADYSREAFAAFLPTPPEPASARRIRDRPSVDPPPVGRTPAADPPVARLAFDASRVALRRRTFDWVCSSHLIEHLDDPDTHLAEIARVLRQSGTAFVITPNAPADFENPFHVHLVGAKELATMLERHFADVWVGGIDATRRVKAEFEHRRARARRLLALDFLRLRHRLPRSWYVAAYSSLLPVAYRLLVREKPLVGNAIGSDDFFVTEFVDDTTLVLFAIATRPLESAA